VFISSREQTPIYDKPSFSGNLVGHIGIGQEVKVTGNAVVAEGWIWQEVEGGSLWLIERSSDFNPLLVFLEWRGQGKPPRPAGLQEPAQPQVNFPAVHTPFTNGQLVEAFKRSAQSLGVPDQFDEWLGQAGLTAIQNNPNQTYSGTPIPQLTLDDEIKLTIIAKLNAITDAGEVPATRPQGRFATDEMRFLLDGKPFRFVGVNVRELAYYGYPGWSVGGFARPEFIDVQLKAASDMRAQVVRIYAPFSRNKTGAEGTDFDEAINRIRKVLDKAKALNMFVLVTLDDAKQSGFNVATNNAKYREPGYVYNTTYYYGGYKENYIPFVRAVVGALGGHPALFAWGICNESQVNPFVPPTPPDRDCLAFLDYYEHTSQVIRSLAPGDLITTSIEACHNLFVINAYEQKKYGTTLYTMPTIDFATVHSYQSLEKPGNFLGHNHERGSIEVDLARRVWKCPIIIEEMGPVGGKNRGDGGIWVRNAITKWFEMGVAGCMQWGFSAADSDIGVGDADSGMHNVGHNHPNLPGHDWGSMFEAYRSFGKQFWVG
jgi:hypothetical protein